MAIGIFFFAIVIAIVRNYYKTVRACLKIFHTVKDDRQRELGLDLGKNIFSRNMNLFFQIGLFGVLCCLVGGAVLLNVSIPIYILFGVLFLLRGWIVSLSDENKFDLKDFAIRLQIVDYITNLGSDSKEESSSQSFSYPSLPRRAKVACFPASTPGWS